MFKLAYVKKKYIEKKRCSDGNGKTHLSHNLIGSLQSASRAKDCAESDLLPTANAIRIGNDNNVSIQAHWFIGILGKKILAYWHTYSSDLLAGFPMQIMQLTILSQFGISGNYLAVITYGS